MNNRRSQSKLKPSPSPTNPLQRQRLLTQFLRHIGQSQFSLQVDSPQYADAVHQALMSCCLAPDAIGTGQTCECHQQTFTDRFNQNLQKYLQCSPGNTVDGTDQPLRTETPEARCDSASASDVTSLKTWVDADPTGNLNKTCLQNNSHINCQMLIARQLTSGGDWKNLAAEWGVSMATLGRFYQRQCLCHLRTLSARTAYSSKGSNS